MWHVCVGCNIDFWTRKSISKFCGSDCYQEWRLETGNIPGTFQNGHIPHYVADIGDITARFDKYNKERQWIKTEIGWQHLCIFTWESTFGRLIRGDVVHHINGDSMNDGLNNLIALPRSEHPTWHNRYELRQIPPHKIDYYKMRYITRMLGVC